MGYLRNRNAPDHRNERNMESTSSTPLRGSGTLQWYVDFNQWEEAVSLKYPGAILNDNGSKLGLRCYFDMSRRPGEREVGRWLKAESQGWVRR